MILHWLEGNFVVSNSELVVLLGIACLKTHQATQSLNHDQSLAWLDRINNTLLVSDLLDEEAFRLLISLDTLTLSLLIVVFAFLLWLHRGNLLLQIDLCLVFSIDL